MALIINIETATTVCSVALSRDGLLLSLREVNEGFTHSEKLTVFIEQMMKEAGIPFSMLDAVAVSSGPGSYTGLRIGVSTAKGLCFALDKPLIAIPTLKSLALKSRQSTVDSRRSDFCYCSMLDARRMEVYCAVYDENLAELEPVSAKVMDENSFSELLKEKRVYFFGDGAAKCKPLLSHHPNAVFMDDLFTSAAAMIELAEEKFLRRDFENVALFEPFYLKEFVAGKKGTAL